MMKRVIGVMVAVAVVAVLAGAALAQGPGFGMGHGWGMGSGPGSGMGWGARGMGPGMMGGWAGQAGQAGQAGPTACPGWAGTQGVATPEQITEEKAKEVATEYTAKYLTGFTVERVLPVTGMPHTMYQVELRGPKGETRLLHVTPWGGVRPFGPPVAATR